RRKSPQSRTNPHLPAKRNSEVRASRDPALPETRDPFDFGRLVSQRFHIRARRRDRSTPRPVDGAPTVESGRRPWRFSENEPGPAPVRPTRRRRISTARVHNLPIGVPPSGGSAKIAVMRPGACPSSTVVLRLMLEAVTLFALLTASGPSTA